MPPQYTLDRDKLGRGPQVRKSNLGEGLFDVFPDAHYNQSIRAASPGAFRGSRRG
jgi:hypothetical protein